MKKLLIIVLIIGVNFCALSVNATQEKKSTPASSDTTGTQINKSKKPEPKYKLKKHKPTKKEMGPIKIDSINHELYRPLLRQKDSSQNDFH